MPETWTGEWSTPVFYLAERERRWGAVRAAMAQQGVDVIVCFPSTNLRDRSAGSVRYLTQLGENSDEVACVFPREGEVTAWLTRGGVWPASSWITDVRPSGRRWGAAVVERLTEMGVSRQTIGIAALRGGTYGHIREPDGEVPHGSLEVVMTAFPNAEVVDATDLIGELRYVKSPEEIEVLRKATAVAEEGFKAAVATARPGVPERHVFGAMMEAELRAGGSAFPMFGWSSGPLGNTYHRVEQPSFRIFEAGDVFTVEIEGRWAGYISQIDSTIAIGHAHPDLRDGHALAVECFWRAMDACKPGNTIGDLVRAGRVSGMNGRGEARLIFHGRGAGDDGPMVTEGPGSSEIVLKPGVSFVLKPGTTVDGRMDYGRWGEAMVITETGAERLGTRGTDLPIVW